MSSRIAVLSSAGQVQLVDTAAGLAVATAIDDCVHQIAGADASPDLGALASTVDVSDPRAVGRGQRIGKLGQQRQGSLVLVRLERDQQSAARKPAARSVEHDANLGGMMGVVVDQDPALRAVHHFEATLHTSELRKTLTSAFEVGAGLVTGESVIDAPCASPSANSALCML